MLNEMSSLQMLTFLNCSVGASYIELLALNQGWIAIISKEITLISTLSVLASALFCFSFTFNAVQMTLCS